MYSTARQQRDCQLTPPSPSMAIFKPFSPLWGPKWGPIRLPMSLRTTNSDFLHLVCRKKVHLSHLGPIARPHRPKNGKNGPPRGPRGQTGSRNMAATTQIDFLTLVSYSTLNTFGVYLAPLRLYPCERLPLRPLQRKSGHFGPFPAPGKLLPVFQIYFLFEPLPQKRCTAPPADNGTGKRRLQAHLRLFLSHFRHFGGQNGGQYGFRCPYGPQIPTSCTQFAVRRSTCAIWDQSLGHTGQKMAKTALRGALEAKQEVEIWRRPHRSIF